MELADVCFPVLTDDDSFPVDCALKKWSELLLEATIKAGRPIDSARSYKSQMEAAGFTGVTEVQYKWPQNRWPRNKRFKELGVYSFLFGNLTFSNPCVNLGLANGHRVRN